MGARAYEAAPRVRSLLRDSDPWLQCLACDAIWDLGPDVYKESVVDLLRMLVTTNPADPRKISHRYAAKALFNRYKGSSCRIVQAGLLEDIDRKLLYPAIRSVLNNEDGWARSFVGSLYKDLPDRDLKLLMPDILKAVEELPPSGIMFASGIRMSGLEILSKHKVSEGIELLVDYARNQKKHGSERRIVEVMKMLKAYGAHAKRVIGRLEATAKYFDKGEEGYPRNLSLDKAKLVRETIKEIQNSTDKPKLMYLKK